MTKADLYKWNVYAQVAYALNKAKIPHSAMHGVDYAHRLVGRDCDLLVKKENTEQVKTIIKNVYDSLGGRNRFISWSWGFGGLHFVKIDDEIFTVEIDVAWTYSYRIVELTDLTYLSYHMEEDRLNEFYIDDWNQYAKVFLLRFLSSDFSKFDEKRIEEVKDISRRIHPPYHVLSEYIYQWVDACKVFDVPQLKKMRTEFSLMKYLIKHPLSSMSVFCRVAYYALTRIMKIHTVLPPLVLEKADEAFINKLNKCIISSFITRSVIYHCNSKVDFAFKRIYAYFFTVPFSLPVFIINRHYHKGAIIVSKGLDAHTVVDILFDKIFSNND